MNAVYAHAFGDPLPARTTVGASAASDQGRDRLRRGARRRSRLMPGCRVERVTKVYDGDVLAVDDVSLEIAAGRVHGPGRALGLRQVDPAAGDRRARAGDQGPGLDRRRGRDHARAARPRRGDGVPELRPVPAQDGAREPRLRAAPGARCRSPRSSERIAAMAAMLGLEELLERQAGGALGRPAPAGGDGPGAGPRAARIPDGRAALEPGREAAHEHARRARPPARAAADDDRLRHPRPGRGDDPGRAGGGAARRGDPADATSRSGCSRTRRTCSWARSSARRR